MLLVVALFANLKLIYIFNLETVLPIYGIPWSDELFLKFILFGASIGMVGGLLVDVAISEED